MRPVSRREFLYGTAAGGALLGLGASGALAQTDKFDLVIKGGEVLDPGQKLRAQRDIGIRNAVIAALEPDIADARAKQLLDAKGKLVLPGLVDMHAHVYPGVSALGLPADELVPYTATTTYVSAGDAGANTFSALKHYIVGQARSRIYAFVHISSIGLSGFPVGEMLNIDYADIDQAAKTLGVIIEVGHGGGSFDYTVAEPAIQQGLVPDTIGSDIHAVSGNTPGMPYLPWVMSKFLNMGFSLEQVVTMATSAPAKVIGRLDKLGTLAVAAPADVSIL